MIFPVDPIAASGVSGPGRFITLRDGTVIPLTGAFGEDIAKLSIGERPPGVIAAGLDIKPSGSGVGPWSPTPSDQANAALSRVNRAAAREDDLAPETPEGDDAGGSLAAPKPGEPTIGEWLGERFRDAMGRIKPGGTFGMDAPIGSITVPPPGSDEPYRGGALVESYTAPGTIPGASITPLPPPPAGGVLSEGADRGVAPSDRPAVAAPFIPPRSPGQYREPGRGPVGELLDELFRPRGSSGFTRGQLGVVPTSVQPQETPQGAFADPNAVAPLLMGDEPTGPAAVSVASPYLGFGDEPKIAPTEGKPKGKGGETTAADKGGATAASPAVGLGPGAGLSAPAVYRGGAFADEGKAGGTDHYVDLYNKLSGQVNTEASDLTDEDLNDLLLETGLRMMAASSRPGASLFGAAGEAGFGAMASKRQMKHARRKEASDAAKLKLDLAKQVTDLAMDAEKLEIDRRKANQEYDLGLRKSALDEQQLLGQQAHWRAIEGNAAAANAIALENLNRQTREDQITANTEWRRTVSDLTTANEQSALLAQARGDLATPDEAALIRSGRASPDLYNKFMPKTVDEIERAAAFANPGAEGAVQWAMEEYRSLLFVQEEIARDINMEPASKKAKLTDVQRQLREILRVWGPADDEEGEGEE